MGKIHVLDGDVSGNYRVVIHIETPQGNNSVGKTWKEVGLKSGKTGTTVLTEGTGAGQISTSEKSQILVGDILEIVDTIPAESGGATVQSLDEMVDKIILRWKYFMSVQLKYYGFVRS